MARAFAIGTIDQLPDGTQIAMVVRFGILWSLKDHRDIPQPGMRDEAAEGFKADVPFADVPVAIHA